MVQSAPGYASRHAWIWLHASRSTQPPKPDDETGLLGQRDEVLRQQMAELRVVPAHQRLEPEDPARTAGA